MRVATLNVLVGGDRRETLIHHVLKRIDADVIALQEITRLEMARELAGSLRMELLLGEPSDPASPHIAIMSRLPVRSWRNRRHPGRMLRSHLHCTVETHGSEVPLLGVHCVHLAARFGERAKGEARRMREIAAVLDGIAEEPDVPHLLLGDFNALSPGEPLAATTFFRRMAALRRAGLIGVREDGLVGPLPPGTASQEEIDAAWAAAGIDPRLELGIPVLPRMVGPLTVGLPVHAGLDRFLGRFIERWTVEHLRSNGYVDSYRTAHPRAKGFTCATWSPAARVDYVFASPDLAPHLLRSEVVGSRGWPDADAAVASDHYPLVAEFSV